MSPREIALTAVLFAVFAAAAAFGLPEAMGAHPSWAVRSGVIGSAIGAPCLAGLRWAGLSTRHSIALSGVCLTLTSLSAGLGKHAFAASFAEDVLAGRFWFLGWFGVAASLFVLVGVLLLDRVRR